MDPQRSLTYGEDLVRLAALEDPLRRRLYDYVCRQHSSIGRDAAARAMSISRSLAAYHLDKLAERGLLSVSFRRPPGRGGPGAGRPAKLYARHPREIVVGVPPRDYALIAELLARAAGEGTAAALAAARSHGREIASAHRDGDAPWHEALPALLRDCGYAPVQGSDGTLRMRNCPFDAVARAHPDLVCSLNVALVEGILEGLGASRQQATLDPQPGCCCVSIAVTR
jgi:predicted ArsR family transcriptional regulator